MNVTMAILRNGHRVTLLLFLFLLRVSFFRLNNLQLFLVQLMIILIDVVYPLLFLKLFLLVLLNARVISASGADYRLTRFQIVIVIVN